MEKRLQGQRSLGNPALDRFNRYFYYVNRHCVFEEGDKLHRGYPKKKRTLIFFGLSCGFPIPQRTLGETVSFYRSQDIRLSHSRSCQWLVRTRTQDPDLLRWEGKRRLNLSILQWRWVQHEPLWDPQGFHSATWTITASLSLLRRPTVSFPDTCLSLWTDWIYLFIYF